MADEEFQEIIPPVVVGVRDIAYTVFDPDPDGEESRSMTYTAQIVWSNGTLTPWRGNVVPHLTQAEVAGLNSLANRLRGKAESVWGNAPTVP
jgi:hypothetical protein